MSAGTQTVDLVTSDPEVLTANLNRTYYWLQLTTQILAILILCGLLLPTLLRSTGFSVLGLGVFVPVIFVFYAARSTLRILNLQEPVLRIDELGIYDKRLTPDPVPWFKIRSVFSVTPYSPSPNYIKVDVGNRRQAGIELVPGTWLSVARPRAVGWDDLVIHVFGLKLPTPLSRWDFNLAICQRADAFRKRHVANRNGVRS